MQGVLQSYYTMADGAVPAFGGGLVAAPMAMVFELQDLGVSSNTPATVLYDGAVTESPASCSFVAVNSLQLFGSMGDCRGAQAGAGRGGGAASGGGGAATRVGVAGGG